MKITRRKILAISLPIMVCLTFINYCHNPYGDGLQFSEKMQAICQQQQGMAIVSLDTIIEQPWDRIYMYVGEYSSNEHIAKEIGDESYFTFLDYDPYLVKRLVFVNRGKIKKYFDLPWFEANNYKNTELRLSVFFDDVMQCSKKDAVFTVDIKYSSGQKEGVDIYMHQIQTSLDSTTFAHTPVNRKQELKTALWRVYPDSMKKYGHRLK